MICSDFQVMRKTIKWSLGAIYFDSDIYGFNPWRNAIGTFPWYRGLNNFNCDTKLKCYHVPSVFKLASGTIIYDLNNINHKP